MLPPVSMLIPFLATPLKYLNKKCVLLVFDLGREGKRRKIVEVFALIVLDKCEYLLQEFFKVTKETPRAIFSIKRLRY